MIKILKKRKKFFILTYVFKGLKIVEVMLLGKVNDNEFNIKNKLKKQI